MRVSIPNRASPCSAVKKNKGNIGNVQSVVTVKL